jgi:Lipopolysaccharide kinase (Kdo/WaaP) family
MLVNLMPPMEGIALREPAIVVAPAEPARGFVVVHPRYRSWLAKCGLRTANDILNLAGEIVSGHANRHVLQVRIPSGGGTRCLYLKREHAVNWRVRLRNWRDGFGRVSRAEREAKVLERLEAAGLPGPHGIAYGEDGNGRAFLLVDELTGCRELREILADPALSPADRRRVAERLGEALADLHAAGFDTPDLAAKHVFVRPGSFAVTVLDWPSSRPGRSLELVDRLDALASLAASLADWLATPRERLRVVKSYLARAGRLATRVAPFARAIAARTPKFLRRSSIRTQRQPAHNRDDQRLVWLAGEAVCANPDVAKQWPRPAIAPPFYDRLVEDGERLELATLPGRPATLLRFRTNEPAGRVVAWLRGKSWRSPAARLSRLFFHLQSAGVPVPRLLAFGQRPDRAFSADSFLLHGLSAGTPALADWIARHGEDREALLAELGGILRTAHDAGCTLGTVTQSAFVLLANGRPRLVVDPTRGARLHRTCTDRLRAGDLATIAPGDRAIVLDGYADARIAELVKRLAGGS